MASDAGSVTTARPTKRRSKKGSMDAIAEDGTEALIEVISQSLRNNRALIPIVYGVVTRKDDDEPERETWDDTNVRFSRVPKKWLWQWFVDLDRGVSEDLIADLTKADPPLLDKLWQFALAMPMHEKVPRLCHDKLVMARVLAKRYINMGDRLGKRWLAQNVGQDGVVNWAEAGVYKFVTPQGEGDAQHFTQIKHIGGCVVDVPPGLMVTQEWVIEKNYSDDAVAKYKYAALPLKALFVEQAVGFVSGDGAGAALTDLANTVNQEVDEQRSSTAKGRVDVSEGLDNVVGRGMKRRGPPEGAPAGAAKAAPAPPAA